MTRPRRRRSDARRAGSRGWKREPERAAEQALAGVGHQRSASTTGRSRHAVSGMATASEPSTNALGRPKRWNTRPPASVSAMRSANPLASNTRRALHVDVGAVHVERRDRSGHDRDDDQDAQALRGGDAVDAAAEALAEDRHLRGAARHAREECRSSCRAPRGARARAPRRSRARSRTARRRRAATTGSPTWCTTSGVK